MLVCFTEHEVHWKGQILKQEIKVTSMLCLFIHPVTLRWGGGGSHARGLPEDSTTHSGPYAATTIQVAGWHFLGKGDLVQPELAVLAVCL